jgi:hypothetical protein
VFRPRETSAALESAARKAISENQGAEPFGSWFESNGPSLDCKPVSFANRRHVGWARWFLQRQNIIDLLNKKELR